ncbi:B3 domain-containing protein At5g42700-like isoform X2 [Rhododendron vialii]|uniref:B3 domain-containing protein At5g42700-like isoform X2 n=1 Tax=Rhododendron vialii TaxID=182163 RepID=UPI00265EEDCD|nr:B3 domain-containing protein At5g42700-like isoform X2 [Rhododendron vialii]
MESEQLKLETQMDSLPMIKQRSPTKGKVVRKRKRSNLKSNAKKVTSDDGGKYGSCKKKRTKIEDLYDNDEAKFSVMERTEEVLANIADGFPGFVKCMLPSNVTHGFWLIFPKKFCNLHLPMQDTTVILVDEWGKEYEANYLVDRHGLSGGWRGFSLAQRLVKGDRLVFYLIKPCTFKIRISGLGKKKRRLWSLICEILLKRVFKKTIQSYHTRTLALYKIFLKETPTVGALKFWKLFNLGLNTRRVEEVEKLE